MFTKVKKVLNIYSQLLLFSLLLLAVLLFFYNLNWGAPYYFHPDERNIASAVNRLRYPDQMNPQFFAYGSLPIYSIYAVGTLINTFSTCTKSVINCEVRFEQAIVISRMFSALLALGTLYFMYLLGEKVYAKKAGMLAVFLGVFSTGFIQFSHFGTFEFWLTFFSILLCYCCLRYYEKPTFLRLVLVSCITGGLIAIKVSSLVFLPLPWLTLLIVHFSGIKKSLSSFLKKLPLLIADSVIFFVVAAAVYIITNPFVFLDSKAFWDSMHYESSVALGTLPVFYTGEFVSSIPVIFQFLNVFPFLVNPVITVLFPFCFLIITWQSFKKKNFSYRLLLGFFLIFFLSQAILYVKWTRYMLSTLPFIYLICSIAFFLSIPTIKNQVVKKLLFSGIIGVCMLFSLSYFIVAFVEKDTRIEARDYAIRTIPAESTILSEVYDLGITPFNDHFPHIDLFNFYDLEQQNPETNDETLKQALASHDYIILPSQRILKTRLFDKKAFAKGYIFYHNLTEGDLPFTKIYETPCDIFCKIVYLGDPIYRFEETANVFDRPVVEIYKKT